MALLFAMPFCVFAQELGTSSITDESQIQISTTNSTNEADILLNSGTASASSWVFIRMILVLAVVIAIIYLFFKLLKKNNDTQDSGDQFLRRVCSVSVAPGKYVQVVTLIDEAFLIGVSDSSVNLISKIEDKELVQAMNLYADQHGGVKRPVNFSEVLNMFMGKKNETSNTVYDGSTEQVLDMLQKQGQRLEDKQE